MPFLRVDASILQKCVRDQKRRHSADNNREPISFCDGFHNALYVDGALGNPHGGDSFPQQLGEPGDGKLICSIGIAEVFLDLCHLLSTRHLLDALDLFIQPCVRYAEGGIGALCQILESLVVPADANDNGIAQCP